MKLYEVLFKSISEIKNLLTQSGLTDGISLTPTEIKTSQAVLFWYIEVKNEEASRKSTYVTFSISNIQNYSYADGKIFTYKADVDVNIFTNKEDVSLLISDINNASETMKWDFDLAARSEERRVG